MRYLIGICLLLVMSFPLHAQERWDDEFQMLRPECSVMETSLLGEVRLAPRRVGSQATAPLKAKGVQKVPVVLVAFADQGFSVADTNEGVIEYYQKFCNGTKDGHIYTGHGSHGSIRDFFVEQSDSVFLPEFVVIGPVVLDNDFSYYGANKYRYRVKVGDQIVTKDKVEEGDVVVDSILSQRDVNYSKFASESIAKAMEVFSDWSQFDNDGNNTIDILCSVFAGFGENVSGVNSNYIWPKEVTKSETINGRVFATNAVTCEMRPASKKDDVIIGKPDGVGVFIHELSHALGLPDFYDTENEAFGMDVWSVMDYGEYGNNGYNPGNYTAYERDFMGWRKLVDLTEPCVLTIPCFADGGVGYKIQNAASANEYYIIENRQQRGWDDYIGRMGHGLQVTHVDFDASTWNRNRVNSTADHQRMTIIAANDCYKGTNSAESATEWRATLAGNLFPGDTYNFNLTDETTPAAAVYTGGLLHKPLRNITENEDGTVTVCFMTNGRLDAPLLREPENIMMDQFDIEWETVDHATQYAYEVIRDGAVIQEGVTEETSVHVERLMPSSELEFHVKAMADQPEDYIDSPWSESQYFSTLADYIDELPESEKLVNVYSSNGVWMTRCYADQIHRLSFRSGIYILRYANGASRKVLIK